MISNWFNEIRNQTVYIHEAIKNHPFIKELLEGSLSKDIFQFYIQQDSIYLAEYKKVLALIGLKCSRAEDIQFFLDAATGIIDVERGLHETFMSDTNDNIEASPTCELYISYLSKMTANYTLEEGLATVLPCFTIYKEVGDYILANQENNLNNPYQSWIDTYGGEEFAKSVEEAIKITNYYADQASSKRLEKMNSAFEKASKLEWMFWDSAYHQEHWKI